jgi:hypothetical protein
LLLFVWNTAGFLIGVLSSSESELNERGLIGFVSGLGERNSSVFLLFVWNTAGFLIGVSEPLESELDERDLISFELVFWGVFVTGLDERGDLFLRPFVWGVVSFALFAWGEVDFEACVCNSGGFGFDVFSEWSWLSSA